MPGTLASIGSSMFNALANGITSVAGAVHNAAVSCITQAITYIKALPAQAVQWGSDFINGLARGITSAANAVVEKVRGIAENIRSMLHFSRPDEGPLRDYEKWPVDFIHGYADAMRGAMPYLQKTLDGITAGMAVMVNGSPLATAGAGAGADYQQHHHEPDCQHNQPASAVARRNRAADPLCNPRSACQVKGVILCEISC